MDNVSSVKEKIDIVELINGYTPLKRAGKNYKGLCPFHKENTPSFMVSEDLQRYRCFGCGKSGDIFNFVMDMEGVEFSEALQMLARRAGVELQHDKSASKDRGQKQKLTDINMAAADFYHYLLTKHKFGKPALEYLKSRGTTEPTIHEFKLGYAPKSWDSLSKYLLSKGFSYEDITKSGLGKFRKDNKNTYDMFRGRLMIPLYDHMNRVVGFSGRALEKDQEPKYMNTPETEIFHKERFLFGLNLAKQYIRKSTDAIIVEGIFDMITPYQYGFKNIIASQGTALTLSQITLLKRYAKSAVLIFDNDDAGLEAAVRGIKVIQNAGLNLKIALIPKGAKDPDELVRQSASKFEDIVKNAIPLWDFYFVYARTKYNFDDVFEKKTASDFLAEMISQIDDPIVQAEYVKKLAGTFDVDEASVKAKLDKGGFQKSMSEAQNVVGEEKIAVVPNEFAAYPRSEIYLLGLLTKLDPKNIETYIQLIDDDYFSNDATKILFQELKTYEKHRKGFDIKAFYDRLHTSHPEAYNLFETIYLLDLEDNLDNPEIIESEVASAIQRLKAGYLKQSLKSLSLELRKAELASDSARVRDLQSQVQLTSQELTKLNSL